MTITLNTFVPGTKAKADEVNANFTALKKAVESKADMNGDSSETFAAAEATESYHVVNKSQMNELNENLIAEIEKNKIKFCARSGYTTDGEADLFSYSGYTITPKICGTYDNLVIANYLGIKTTILETPDSISLSGNADGDYNIFINSDGELYVLKNTIYRQKTRPDLAVNDIWLDTSTEPFNCIKYTSSGDAVFLDTPLGKATFAGNEITAIETFAFNQNGYELNSESFLKDFSTNGWTKLPNGLILQWGTTTIKAGTASADIKFPVEFPNTVFFAIASKNCADAYATRYTSLTNTEVIFRNTSSDSNAGTFLWLALGY